MSKRFATKWDIVDEIFHHGTEFEAGLKMWEKWQKSRGFPKPTNDNPALYYMPAVLAWLDAVYGPPAADTVEIVSVGSKFNVEKYNAGKTKQARRLENAGTGNAGNDNGVGAAVAAVNDGKT